MIYLLTPGLLIPDNHKGKKSEVLRLPANNAEDWTLDSVGF